MKKILIAPWGDFLGWSEVSYKYKEVEMSSRTTLPVVCEAEDPDKIIIIVLDSLIVNFAGNELTSYESELKKVEDNTREYVGKIVRKPVNIIVSPSTGTFKGRINKDVIIKTKGNVTDFYYFTYYKLAEELTDCIGEDQCEIILDITHGINFQTIGTYKIVKNIAQLLAFFLQGTISDRKHRVKFMVLNSDPFFAERELLYVNEIENFWVTPLFIIESVAEKVTFNLIKGRGKEINDKIKELLPDGINLSIIGAFLSAFKNLFPLQVFYFAPDPKSIATLLREIVFYGESSFVKMIEIQGNEMARKLTLYQGIELLVDAWLVAKGLKEFFEFEPGTKEIELEFLKKFVEVLPDSVMYRVKSDVSSLDKILKEETIPYDEWKLYREIEESKGRKVSPQLDERNFVAHSGLEYNSLEILKGRDGKILLRIPEKTINEEINILLNLL